MPPNAERSRNFCIGRAFEPIVPGPRIGDDPVPVLSGPIIFFEALRRYTFFAGGVFANGKTARE